MAGLAPVFIVLIFLYRPLRYNPPTISDSNSQIEISPYLTNELLPQLYNGSQMGEPFDLVVTQKGINDVVVRNDWPMEFNGIKVSRPEVFFTPDRIAIMGTVIVKGVEFVVTVEVIAGIDCNGLMSLWLDKVKLGAANVTIPARIIAANIYSQQIANGNIKKGRNDFGMKVADALLNGKPFEPVFKIEDKKVRAKKIIVEQGKLTVNLVPALN